MFFYNSVLLQQCFLAILFHCLRTSLAKNCFLTLTLCQLRLLSWPSPALEMTILKATSKLSTDYFQLIIELEGNMKHF